VAAMTRSRDPDVAIAMVGVLGTSDAIKTRNTRTGSAMFFSSCSPKSSKAAATLPLA
jgi:hypothetical protein